MTPRFRGPALALALAIFATCGLGSSARAEPPKAKTAAHEVRVARGKRGVVVSAHLDASRAGVALLSSGGNALDAAVAVAYALSVVEPFSAGIGGGGFLLYFDAKTQKTTIVDYREVAPKRAHRDMYLVDGKVDPRLALSGMLSVAVPGMVPGLDFAQKKLGKKRLADVVAPALRLAEQGFLVTPRFYDASVDQLENLRGNPAAAAVFLKDGEPYPIGERLVQKDLAKTLRELSRVGPTLFTHGRIAKAMAAESARLGGVLTLEDLAAFKPRLREPLTTEWRGYTVVTMPPPSSGGTHLIQMLEMLELDRARRGLGAAGASAGRGGAAGASAGGGGPGSGGAGGGGRERTVDDVHVLAEVMRRAYADRATFMGDPAFVKSPLEGLLAPDYLAARFATIDLAAATPSSRVTAGNPKGGEAFFPEPNDTTHLTVIDEAGNIATLTQTVNYNFGSGVVVPGTGVLLNNEMDDFASAPGVPNVFGLVGGEANSIQPGKIPLSSMTPTLVLERGRPRLALGAPGGSTIITTVLQIILNVLERGMDVAAAVAEPRLHMQWLPDELRHEPRALTDEQKRELTRRGFKLTERTRWGNATAIEILPDGTRVGAADPRGDGAGDAQ